MEAKKSAAKKSAAKKSAAKKPVAKKPTAKKPVAKKPAAKKPAAKKSAAKKPRSAEATTSNAEKAIAERYADDDGAPHIFPIVGLGASAGGLEALVEFFRHMPCDSDIAFVVVMHQSAKHISLLPELLAKSTAMDVVSIRSGMTIEQGVVYVAP
ncbi:MAG: chemotaxis response regulator CheB, partial [Pirellulaceae bacterium]